MPVSHPPKSPGLSYRDAGVDIDAGNELVQRIKPLASKTFRPEVLSGLGGFGALFELPLERYRQPVLVSGTDGVGTKLKLAQRLQRHETIGIDLVAMCVNDIVVQGAEPLFFLDYFATGQLDVAQAAEVVKGIAQGCMDAGCALIGGETAEMPGMYAKGDYDLAGFAVGIVEKDEIIDGSRVTPGDAILGLAASGPHSNGYSLIRRVLDTTSVNLSSTCGNTTLADALMMPTRIYVRSLLELMRKHPVHALAHITGGGILENIPRVLPTGTNALIDERAWPRAAVFDWLSHAGKIDQHEMLRTFNCGIGMVVILPNTEIEAARVHFEHAGIGAFHIGDVVASDTATPRVELLTQAP